MEDSNKQLTRRERQVVKLIAENKKYKDIAVELGLGYETVKTYASRIRRKLGVNSKLAVALWAMKQEFKGDR
jgi:DNA-binding CsgD family transcriptional regulator